VISIDNRWIDDHLELYTYARSIGDTVWADELASKININHPEYRAFEHAFTIRELWNHFDLVNEQMHAIFLRRERENPFVAQKIISLKQKRSTLLSQIQNFGNKDLSR
jgi:hypothetical protein